MVSQSETKTPNLVVKVDGTALSQGAMRSLAFFEIDTSATEPDYARLGLQLEGLDSDTSAISDDAASNLMQAAASLIVTETTSSPEKVLFDGEVVSVSIELSDVNENGPMLLVLEGYDRSHRMMRARKSRTFQNQKISDVATTIANEYGLTGRVTATSGVHEYIVQNNQTDYEFLRSMADRVGYQFIVRAQEMSFEDPTAAQRVTLDLAWGKELAQFRVMNSTANQPSEVVVRGWDPASQRSVVGKSKNGSSLTAIGNGKQSPQVVDSTFGSSPYVVGTALVDTQDKAQQLADAVANELADGFVYAEGSTAWGRADVEVGTLLNIAGAGKAFSGKYLVTGARHTYSGRGGYVTKFVAGKSGAGLLNSYLTTRTTSPVTNGLAIGVVTNVNDPDNTSRVKVKLPWLSDDLETDWIRVASPGAGKNRGMQVVPEVNDEVIVGFEHGDVAHPVVLGSLWSKANTPPEQTSTIIASGVVNQRIIRSRSGHTILLDDTDGSEKILIKDNRDKEQIVMDAASGSIAIESDQAISIKTSGSISLEGSNGDVQIKCINFSVDASGNCNLGATGNFSAKGAQSSLEGSATAEVKGGAQTKISGAMVQIN